MQHLRRRRQTHQRGTIRRRSSSALPAASGLGLYSRNPSLLALMACQSCCQASNRRKWRRRATLDKVSMQVPQTVQTVGVSPRRSPSPAPVRSTIKAAPDGGRQADSDDRRAEEASADVEGKGPAHPGLVRHTAENSKPLEAAPRFVFCGRLGTKLETADRCQSAPRQPNLPGYRAPRSTESAWMFVGRGASHGS